VKAAKTEVGLNKTRAMKTAREFATAEQIRREQIY
jgi:hypothetical protein